MKIREEVQRLVDGNVSVLSCEYCGETSTVFTEYNPDASTMFYLRHLHCAVEHIGGLLSRQEKCNDCPTPTALEEAPVKRLRKKVTACD